VVDAVHLLGGVPVVALLHAVVPLGIVAVIEPDPVSVDAVVNVTAAVPSAPVVTVADDAPPIEPGPLCVKVTLTPWTAFPNLSVTVAVNFCDEPGATVGPAGASAIVYASVVAGDLYVTVLLALAEPAVAVTF
jgi:hypothetical protein